MSPETVAAANCDVVIEESTARLIIATHRVEDILVCGICKSQEVPIVVTCEESICYRLIGFLYGIH